MKFIDLAPTIKRDHMTGPITGLDGETYTLKWLDEHPDQVPGRTITESEAARLWYDANNSIRDAWPMSLLNHGITVIPDPKPTNAELLADDIRQLDFEGTLGSAKLAEELTKRGWTKGDDDES